MIMYDLRKQKHSATWFFIVYVHMSFEQVVSPQSAFLATKSAFSINETEPCKGYYRFLSICSVTLSPSHCWPSLSCIQPFPFYGTHSWLLWIVRCRIQFLHLNEFTLSLSCCFSFPRRVLHNVSTRKSIANRGMAIYYIMLEFKWLHWVTNMKTFAYIRAKVSKPGNTRILRAQRLFVTMIVDPKRKRGLEKPFSSYDSVCIYILYTQHSTYFIISATLSNSSQKANCFHTLPFDDIREFFAWVSFSRLWRTTIAQSIRDKK